MELKTQILEMIRLSSTNLSADVEKAIVDAAEKEDEGSPAKNALNTIIEICLFVLFYLCFMFLFNKERVYKKIKEFF